MPEHKPDVFLILDRPYAVEYVIFDSSNEDNQRVSGDVRQYEGLINVYLFTLQIVVHIKILIE